MTNNKYWVVGTSTTKYIKTFMSILKMGAKVGDEISINIENKNTAFIFYRNESINLGSQTTLRQTIDAFLALNLIRKSRGAYLILFDECDFDDIVDYSKIFLTKHSDDSRVNKYRFSKVLNTLVQAGWVTEADVLKMGIEQTRGLLTIDKIYKEISSYEKHISKDENFLKKAKEKIYE